MSISRWTDKEVVVHVHNGILLSYEKECIWVSSNEVDETGAYYIEWSKSERETPMQYINTYIWNLERWLWWPYMQGGKRDTDVKNRLGTLWEKARVGRFERIALKHVYYHMWNRLPVQVRCMTQCTQGWCTGMTLRDGMGFRMGNTCTPMADSCECRAKTTIIL